MTAPTAPAARRNRLPLWGGLLGLMLLFPVVVIPLLVELFAKPAFESVDEITADQVRSLELLLLNRTDGGDDVGSPRKLYRVPDTGVEDVLKWLRNAERVPSDNPRGIWLGRMHVKLHDGRKQTIMLHRPKHEYDASRSQRLEIRIGRNQFLGPEVKEFTRAVGEMAGVPPKTEEVAKP